MRIALVQVASDARETVAQRRDRVGRMLLDARDADLVVLPELWNVGYFAFSNYADKAEPMHGETVTAAASWARDLGCHLHMGSFVERTDRGELHNTAVLLGPGGDIEHTYRKIHVFGYQSLESTLLSPGSQLEVASTALGPVAATTCYDLRFPELWRRLVDQGAETIITPAAWPAVRLAHWRVFTTCRAIEQQVHVVACNAVGEQNGTRLGGHSRVVDPWGEVLAEAGDDEGITMVDVDRGTVAAARHEFPVLADRRLDIAT